MTGGRAELRRAEIIAVGSEMLTPDRSDTNSLYVTARLNELGIDVAAKAVVGDHLDTLASVFAAALDRSDLVVITGGLGPTDDDLTRLAVARVLGRTMSEDAATVERIRARFARRGWPMPEINRRQAQVIEGAALLENRHGTAPGQWVEIGDRVVVLLPGPPRELRPMIDVLCGEHLARRAGRRRLLRRTVGIAGQSESHAEEILKPLYAEWGGYDPPVEATILAAFGLIELHLSARAEAADEAARSLAAAAASVEAAFGLDVFTTDDRDLARVVGSLLAARGWRVALAESCTGGLIAKRLTDVAGSSAFVESGVVAYSNEAKTRLLGVPVPLLERHGAVSEPVAAAMAEGARAGAHVEIGVGVTGIAGPAGGTEAKPVGTVAIAVAGPGERLRVRTFLFPGNREHVRGIAAQTAIDMVRRAVLQSSP